MSDVNGLIKRVDEEVAAEVGRQKENWAERVAADRAREARLQHFDTEAEHIVQVVKPRLDAFLERFKAVAQVEAQVRQHTRGAILTFAATIAQVTLRFEVFPDQDASHVRLECTIEIIPVVVPCNKRSVLAFPLDGVRDDAVVQWFDDSIIDFVKAYIAMVRQDPVLRERLKDQFVEDPVAKIEFPKYLASSTLERDGRTYYFVDEDTRRAFEQNPEAQ
jgi:YHS domain-containing protein